MKTHLKLNHLMISIAMLSLLVIMNYLLQDLYRSLQLYLPAITELLIKYFFVICAIAIAPSILIFVNKFGNNEFAAASVSFQACLTSDCLFAYYMPFVKIIEGLSANNEQGVLISFSGKYSPIVLYFGIPVLILLHINFVYQTIFLIYRGRAVGLTSH